MASGAPLPPPRQPGPSPGVGSVSPESSLLLVSSVFPKREAVCPSVRPSAADVFLSLLFFLPLALLSPLRAPRHAHSSIPTCHSLFSLLPAPPSSLATRLVHGGKGTRFTLSEDIYPEKGTCQCRPPPAPGARCLRPSRPG